MPRIDPYGPDTLLCCLPYKIPSDVRLTLRLTGFKYHPGIRISGKGGWIAKRTKTTTAVTIWLEDARHTDIIVNYKTWS